MTGDQVRVARAFAIILLAMLTGLVLGVALLGVALFGGA